MTRLDVARGAAHVVRGTPLPYIVPPAVGLANLTFAAFLAHTWGAYAHQVVWEVAFHAALILACSAAVVWATWSVGRARRIELRFASLLMSTTSCGGLFVLTFRGVTGGAVGVYLLVMLCASVLLGLTRLLRGDGNDVRPSVFGELGERVKELKDIGKVSRPRVVDGQVTANVEMQPGGSFAELQKPDVRTAIASTHDIPVNGVRMVADPTTPRKGRIELSPVDMLEHPPAWPGLSAPGGSIAAPIRLAVYRHGRPVPLLLTGDTRRGRNAIGVMVLLGQSGSGKTEFQLFLAAEARSRHNCRVTYIDGRKGLQLPAALRNNMHTFIHDATVGERYLDSMIRTVASRAAQIGGHGHAEWTDGCTQCPPFDVVIVDEASKFIEAEETLVELAESIRSVGIFMLLGIQRGTGDRLPTSVRSTTGARACMGVKNIAEGGRLLSDSTIEAGADPSWANNKPGAIYLELPGVPPEEWSVPARTFKPDRDAVLGELVAYVSTENAAPVPVSAVETAEEIVDAKPADEDDSDCPPVVVDPELVTDEDPREPITVPARPRLDLTADPQRSFTPSEVRDMFRNLIMRAREKNYTQVKPSMFYQIVEIVGEDGLKPPTVTKILGELCRGDAPLLRKAADRGVYEILPAT